MSDYSPSPTSSPLRLKRSLLYEIGFSLRKSIALFSVLPSPNILSTLVASFLGFSSPYPSKLSADSRVSAHLKRTASPLTDLLSAHLTLDVRFTYIPYTGF